MSVLPVLIKKPTKIGVPRDGTLTIFKLALRRRRFLSLPSYLLSCCSPLLSGCADLPPYPPACEQGAHPALGRAPWHMRLAAILPLATKETYRAGGLQRGSGSAHGPRWCVRLAGPRRLAPAISTTLGGLRSHDETQRNATPIRDLIGRR
jgi:hypothetical protein